MFGGSFQKSHPFPQLVHSQNPMVLSNQPIQQQQQQQQNPINQFQTPNQTSQLSSRFEKYENVKDNNLISSDNVDNLTSGSALRKRTIPKKLVKRIKKADNNTDETDKPSAPILPFKASTQFQEDTFSDDFAHIYEHNKLPIKSLFDPSLFNDDNSSSEILIGSVFSDISENPIAFNNVFQRRKRIVKANTSFAQASDLPWSTSMPNSKVGTSIKTIESGSNHKHNLQKLYCSVIVYGFNDEDFSFVINHFAKYGDIMEDLNVSESSNNQLRSLLLENKPSESKEDSLNKNDPSKFPLFIGNGWIKITYDNPNSAIRALVDNGTDYGNGKVLGVMPYRKQALELLLNTKLNDDLDVGEGLRGLNYDLGFDSNFADNEIGRYFSDNLLKDQCNGDVVNTVHTKIGHLKDGSNLILQNVKNERQQNFWNKGMDFFFGKGEV